MKIDKLIRPGELVNLRLRFGVGRALFRASLLVVSPALAVAVLVKYTGWIDRGEGLTFTTLGVLLAVAMLVHWHRAGVIMTNQRLLVADGELEIDLHEIEDLQLQENLFGHLTKLKVQIAGDEVYTVEHIADLSELADAVSVAINKPPVAIDPAGIRFVHAFIHAFFYCAASLGCWPCYLAQSNSSIITPGLTTFTRY